MAAGELRKIARQRSGRSDDASQRGPAENDLTCLPPLTHTCLITQQHAHDIGHEFNIEPPAPWLEAIVDSGTPGLLLRFREASSRPRRCDPPADRRVGGVPRPLPQQPQAGAELIKRADTGRVGRLASHGQSHPPSPATSLPAVTKTIRTAWPLFLKSFGRSLPPGGRALGERIIQHLDHILAAFVKGARTLVHFDYRADNLFIDDRTRKAPIVVVDWQLLMWGLGAYDVARLAGGSIPPAERGGHHEEIVECWHRGLTAGGVTGYSHEEAWHDYRLSAIVAMLNPVLVHHMFKTGGRRGIALGSAMAGRFFDDLVECGAEEVVP